MDGLYIPRAVSPHILEVQKYYSVIIVTGPRQSGKTTLCQHLFSDYKFATMDDIGTRTRALTDMDFFMDSLGENAVIDEVQNCPEVLTAVKNRVDRNSNCRYILTGSCNFSLLHSVSESLAGRCALFELLPFSFPELARSLTDVPTDELMFQYDAFEIKAGKTFRENFLDNLRYLGKLLKDRIKSQTLIYDGPDVAPRYLNVRTI